MMNYQRLFKSLQYGFSFEVKEGNYRFALEREHYVYAFCMSKKGYVFIHFHDYEDPIFSSINVVLHDYVTDTEERIGVCESNLNEIQRKIRFILS